MRTFLLTAGGLGFMRPASGTWGSTPPPAIALLLVALCDANMWVVNVAMLALLIIFSWACVAFGPYAEQRFGKKDPGQVVADEVAGQAIALMMIPWVPIDSFETFFTNACYAGGAFIAFRIFDIIKPPPANALQRLSAGWGILVDDLFAGVYAAIVVQLVIRVVL